MLGHEGFTYMGNAKPTHNTDTHNLSQCLLELDASLMLIERLQELKKIVGNIGPDNPATECDLDLHLSAALGAASHWRLETQINLAASTAAQDRTRKP